MVIGHKCHLLVDTLGVVWAVVVHSADLHDGLLVEHALGYLPRMRKVLVDQAYKKVFHQWVENNIVGLDVEFSSKPPSATVKWRRVNERSFGWLNFFRRHSKG